MTPAAVAWNDGEIAITPTLVATDFVQVDADMLRRVCANVARAGVVTFDLFGNSYVCELAGPEQSFRHEIYRGTVRGAESSSVTFALATDNNVVAGAIEVDDAVYGLHYTGEGDIHVVQRFDHSRETRTCGLKPLQRGSRTIVPPRASAPAPAVQGRSTTAALIDVAVFYTSAARASGGGTNGIQSQVALRVATATTGCQSSGVQHEYRLVYTGELAYSETGTSTDLSRFRTNGDGHMDSVFTIRAQYGADLMNLIINSSQNFCGIAGLMRSNSVSWSSNAYNVTVRTCLSGHTMTHEMGHNMGCAHDRANAGTQGAFPFSYGARTSNQAFRSIMAYSPGSRVNKWSGSAVTHNGLALGSANENNVLSLNLVRNTLANFWLTRTYEWCTHPGGMPGNFGIVPRIGGSGTKTNLEPVDITLQLSANGVPGALVIGANALNVPWQGGTIFPSFDITIPVTGSLSTNVVNIDGLRSLGPGLTMWLQAFYVDPAGVAPGISATDGMSVRTL